MNPYNPSELSNSLEVQPKLFFADEKGVHRQIFKKPNLMFCCQMNENMTDDLYYSVTWYVNDVFLVSKGPVLQSSINDTNLYESELLERGYKLDINVLNPSVNIHQGSSTTIQLQPTFPFGCSSRVDDLNYQTKCLLSVHMFDPIDSNDCKGSSISVTGSQKCGVEISGFYYYDWRDGVRYDNVTEMTITTRDSNDYKEGRNRFELKLLTEGTGLNDIIQGSYISNIVVTTSSETSWQGKTCYSYVDPHMRSFDGRYYENQNIGIFVLYRHKSSKQEEVSSIQFAQLASPYPVVQRTLYRVSRMKPATFEQKGLHSYFPKRSRGF
ncbi:hypothetical protein ACJMK2_018516 [Sinanodonta woodiana]|uniref:Uncharacterized protein n=1 Tax=Sinanodonta woodiana TaxID=1069815 RepID=A0ABD3UGE4_SINWO